MNNDGIDHTLGGGILTTSGSKQRKTSKFVMGKYTLYETKDRMYIVGSNKRETMFRILEIDLTVPRGELSVLEDNVFFTRNEIMNVLASLEEATENGLHKKITGYGLLGFIKFTCWYYLIMVTKYSQVAVIGGHGIYHIDGIDIIPITNNYKKPEKSSDEARLLNIFKDLDLTKTFYFSYTYDITNTLQTNILREKLKAVDRSDITIPSMITDYNEMFVWNNNLLSPIFACIDTVFDWFQCIIHGFIDQVNVSVLGKSIYITLIARRSHHFAGARFLKRGVNNKGYVANEVETEQIVTDMILTPFHQPGNGFFDSDRYTSHVQHRGSIPLYWTQDASNLTTKPPIRINVVDPYFTPAALHFDNLFQRYGGGTIQILNLIKTKEKTPRETKLLWEFEQCVDYLNEFLPTKKKIDYTSWDMSRASKQDGQGVIEFLEKYAVETVTRTGIFHNGPNFASTKIQEGICRSNCIDCLDRTNAAQFVIGKRALGSQLKSLGIIDNSYLEYDSDIVNILTELFHDLGDTIALQYGGSHLVNTMETYRKINQWSSHSRDMIESIKRFYSNSFVDAQRQDAINLFLGHYAWKEGFPSLWEMNTDFYLHNAYTLNVPRRSYTHWWNDYHIKSIKELINEELIATGNDVTREKIIKNVRGYPGAFDNYWNEYYLPRSVTWIRDLFAYNMNSTRRYHNTLTKQDKSMSPFTSRKQSWLNNKLKMITSSKNLEGINTREIEATSLQKDMSPKQELELYEHYLHIISDRSQKLEEKMNSFSYSKYPIFISHENNEIPSLKETVGESPVDVAEDFTDVYDGSDSDDETTPEALLIAPDHVLVDEKFYEKILDVDNYKPVFDNYSTAIQVKPDNLQLYKDLCVSKDIQLEFQ